MPEILDTLVVKGAMRAEAAQGAVSLITKAAAGQTADLHQWQDSAGAIKARMALNGDLSTARLAIGSGGAPPILFERTNSTLGVGNRLMIGANAPEAGATVGIFALDTLTPNLIVKGIASQAGDLTQWQDSAGVVRARVNPAGETYVRNLFIADGSLLSQVGYLQVHTSGGSAAYISSTSMIVPYEFKAAYALLTGTSATDRNLVITGAASQSADMTQWLDSAGVVRAKVTAAGAILGFESVVAARADNSPVYLTLSTPGTTWDLMLHAWISGRFQLTRRGGPTPLIIAPDTVTEQLTLDSWGTNVLSAASGQVALKVKGTRLTRTITNKVLLGNIATLTTDVAHGFTAGHNVTVTGVDSTFDGTYTITGTPTTTTFDYSRTAPDVPSTASGGTATANTQTARLQQWQDGAGSVVAEMYTEGGLVIRNLALTTSDITTSADSFLLRSTKTNLGWQMHTAGGAIDINAYPLATNLRFYSGNQQGLIFRTSTLIGGEQAATHVALVVRGVAAQSADLQQWMDSSGTVLGRFRQDAAFEARYVYGGTNDRPYFDFTPMDTIALQGRAPSVTALLALNSSNTGAVYREMLRTQSAQASGHAQWSLGHDATYDIPAFLIGGSGGASQFFWRAYWGAGTAGLPANTFKSASNTAAQVVVAVKGAAAQTADLSQWQDSAGTVLARVGPSGAAEFGANRLESGGYYTGPPGGSTPRGYIFDMASPNTLLRARLAGDVAVVVRGATSQTGDLTQWQNDTGAVLTKLTAAGDLDFTAGTRGPILTSPDGLVRRRVGIDNTGALTLTAA